MSLKSSILNFIRRINGAEKVFDELNKIKMHTDRKLEHNFNLLKMQIISEVESKIIALDVQYKNICTEINKLNISNMSVKENIGKELLASQSNNAYTFKKLLITAYLHQQTFKPFKIVNQNKDLVLVGAGPTLNDFSKEKIVDLQHPVFLSLNRAFMKKDISFDYLFCIDFIGIVDYADEFFAYPGAIKFIGNQDLGPTWEIPQTYDTMPNIYRYNSTIGTPLNNFAINLEVEPLYNSSTVSIQAMQFALYTQPRRIFLVGIDCTSKGHFIGIDHDLTKRGENTEMLAAQAITDWHRMKDFINLHYPQTEVISVNPVGLKGLFNDIFV